MKALTLVFTILFLTGCSTSGSSNKVFSFGHLNTEKSVLLMSSGRKEKKALISFNNLPFVSYALYRVSKNGAKKVGFFPAEAGVINRLGKGKYGYIHHRELNPGKYYLVGQLGRGSVNAGWLINVPLPPFKFDTRGKETSIVFEFELAPNTVNYLGEILTIKEPLGPDAITVTDQKERDYAYLLSDRPELKKVPFTTVAVNTTQQPER